MGAYEDTLASIPYQPLWLLYLQIVIGLVLRLLLRLIVFCAAKISSKCCGDTESGPRTTWLKANLENILMLLSFCVRIVVVGITYALGIVKVLSVDTSGWHRYQLFVSLMCNSGIALGCFEAFIMFILRAGADAESKAKAEATKVKDVSLSAVIETENKDTRVVKWLERALDVRVYVQMALLFPFFTTHLAPGIIVYFPIIVVYALALMVLWIPVAAVGKNVAYFKRFQTPATERLLWGVMMSYHGVGFAICMNYMVFLYSGCNWVTVMRMDFNLRNTDRYLNATYFAQYQTVLNIVNLFV